MSFKLNLYTFSKKLNSMKLPTGTPLELDVMLKGPCGIMAPVFQLDLGLLQNPSQYNYAQVPVFNRYYFITEWEFSDRLWICHLEEDTLASWRTRTLAQSFYILRAASAYDGRITDDLYPTRPDPVITKVALSTQPWSGIFSAGYFVITVICDGAETGTKYYVTDLTGLSGLTEVLMQDTSWLQVPTQISQGGLDEHLLRTLFNPWQYITTIKWYPFKPATKPGSSSTSINYGWWSLTLASGSVEELEDAAYKSITWQYTLPKHPQAVRGSYLNAAPFTRMRLHCQPFGDIVVDPSPYMDELALQCEVRVDCRTGIGLLRIMDAGSEVYECRQTDFGVDMPVSQIAVDKLNQAETIITGAADTARDALATAAQATNVSNLLNPLSGELAAASAGAQAISTGVHAIADGIRSSVPQMETRGIRGSTAAFADSVDLYVEHYELVPEDLANNGRPLCEIRQLSTMSGYVLIRDGHVDLPGNAGEIAAVKAYLEAGIYVE